MSSASIGAPRSRRKVAISGSPRNAAASGRRRRGVHGVRIRRHQIAQAIEHAQTCGRVDVHVCAAGDEKRHELGVGRIQHAEAARPPVASRVDVGAGVEQHLDHRPIALTHRAQNWRRAEAETPQRIVDGRAERGMLRERLPDPGRCRWTGSPPPAGPVARNDLCRSCDDPTVRLVTKQTTNTDSEDQGVRSPLQ